MGNHRLCGLVITLGTTLAVFAQPALAQQASDALSVEQMLNKLAPEGGETKPRRTRNLKLMAVEPPAVNTVNAVNAGHTVNPENGGNTHTANVGVPLNSPVTEAATAPVNALVGSPAAAAASASSSPAPAVNTVLPASVPPVVTTAPTTTQPAATVASVSGTTAAVITPPTVPAPALDLSILFELGSAKISKASLPTLEKLALVLRNDRLADSQFRIEGHTDITGNATSNLALSSRRAQSVVEFLSARGVDAARMESVGKGSTELLLPDQPQSFRNRRVRVTVLD